MDQSSNGVTPEDDGSDEPIDASAWQMWKVVLKTCGPVTAARTAFKYAWMSLTGKA